MSLTKRKALDREVPQQMHGRINGYEDYPAHLPAPYLFPPNSQYSKTYVREINAPAVLLSLRNSSSKSSQEEPPKKRARFERTANMEKYFYDDVILSILSFLNIEHLSSAMRVSQKFAKISQKALRNTTRLVINYMVNCDDYFKTILGNCTKVKTLRLQKSLLSKAQLYGILEHVSGTLVDLDMFEVCSACFKSKYYGQPHYPIACCDSFLSFVADTLKNLRSFYWAGCFDVDDFLYFSRNCASLEQCGLVIVGARHGVKMDTALEGLEVILLRNTHLKFLKVCTFIGAGELFLRMPEYTRLESLVLVDCKVSPLTKKALGEKYTNLTNLRTREGIYWTWPYL